MDLSTNKMVGNSSKALVKINVKMDKIKSKTLDWLPKSKPPVISRPIRKGLKKAIKSGL